MRRIITLLLVVLFYISLNEISSQTTTFDVYYQSSVYMAGFQFNVNDVVIISAYGGAAEEADFSIDNSGDVVIGFSFVGAVIPPGSGVLVTLEIEGDIEDACISNQIISTSAGEGLETLVNDCSSIVVISGAVYGCTDINACNFYSSAIVDDGSCEYASCLCPEDINGDGVVSVADILELLGQFGCSSDCSIDLNNDGSTNVQDILLLLAAFGTECTG
jgi:hypothetical protein